PLRQSRSDVPKMLDTVYQRMVAKEPVRRQQSMSEVIVELEEVGACVKLSAIGPHRPANSTGNGLEPVVHQALVSPLVSRFKWWLLAGAGSLLALLLLVVAFFAGGERPSDKKPMQIAGARPKMAIPSTIPEQPTPKSLAPPSGTPPALDAWCQQVAGLPPEKQVDAVIKKLQERNSEFNGKLEHQIVKGQVVEVRFLTDTVGDISPLQALRHLQRLECCGSGEKKGRLIDLAPLQGLPLLHLDCSHAQISDLSPLRGLQLTSLDCSFNRIGDLSPLRDMPLTKLNCMA